LRPFDDVYFLAAELGGDDCDAYAALTDECADRVDVFVVGKYRDLCARAWLTNDRFDFYDAEAISGTSVSKSLVKNFGCERERRMNVPRTPSSTRKSKCADALALAIALARDLFVVGKYRGRAAEVDEKIAAFKTLHVAGHDLAFALAVLFYDRSALCFADFLHDHLFGGLCGDAAEIFASLEWERNFFVELRVFFHALRVLEHDVLLRIKS
jgi:hypothetical protein